MSKADMSEEAEEGSSSNRLFALSPKYAPLVQSVVSTIPLAVLLLWFMIEAYSRPSHQECYNNNVQDDQVIEEVSSECSHLVALGDMVVVCLPIALYWAISVGYLCYFIPRRHALVRSYLASGTAIIGDVYFTPRKTLCCTNLASYGTVVFAHPNHETPVYIQRQVFVYEKFTRERTTLLYLPGRICSAQPKSDLQIDYDVAELNHDRIAFMQVFATGWLALSLVCSFYIVLVLNELDSVAEYGLYLLPTYERNIPLFVFLILAFIVIPIISFLVNVIAWKRYHSWMTTKHNIMAEGDSPSIPPSGCCCWEDVEWDDSEKETSFQRMADR